MISFELVVIISLSLLFFYIQYGCANRPKIMYILIHGCLVNMGVVGAWLKP